MYAFLSGIIFSMSLLHPELSSMTMSSFLIPLYFKEQKIRDGFIWGIVVFSTYWWWLLILLQKYQSGVIGYIFYLLLILWCAILSSIWLYFFNQAPAISTTLFFLMITKISMIPIGNLEGMPCMNPIVLLADYPILLWPLHWVGDIAMLLILFVIQGWIANNIKKKKIKGVSIYFFTIMVFQFLNFYSKQEKFEEIPGATVIIPWWYQKGDGMFCGYRLSYDICKAIDKAVLPKIIITPESAFCFDLQEYKSFIPIWCESANNIPILLGTHYFNNKKTHNCIVLLHNDKIIYQYFKKHSMPFLEKSVWLEKIFNVPILSSKLIPDDAPDDTQSDIIAIENKPYQIFLCSELFFETKKVCGYPIILLWNDTWLCCDHAKKLALLFIKYFEKKYQVNVYHVATSGLSI